MPKTKDITRRVKVDISNLHTWDYERFLDKVSEKAVGHLALQGITAKAVDIDKGQQAIVFEIQGYVEK